MPKRLSQTALARFADQLSGVCTAFEPRCVVCIETGGRLLGEALSTRLGVPLRSCAIAYPGSRHWNAAPLFVRPLIWPIKAALYHLGRPAPRARIPDDIEPPLVLVDDSASTGRTVETAIAALEARGISRRDILVAVIRSGAASSALVDCSWRPKKGLQ